MVDHLMYKLMEMSCEMTMGKGRQSEGDTCTKVYNDDNSNNVGLVLTHFNIVVSFYTHTQKVHDT